MTIVYSDSFNTTSVYSGSLSRTIVYSDSLNKSSVYSGSLSMTIVYSDSFNTTSVYSGSLNTTNVYSGSLYTTSVYSGSIQLVYIVVYTDTDMQNSLNIFYNYCVRWKRTVNGEETKFIIGVS